MAATPTPRDPRTENDLIAVYADPEIARGVARRITDMGVHPEAVRLGGVEARVTALKAEMREEVDNTFVGPGNMGPFTKEMTKGIVHQIGLWTIALAILGGLLALFDWPASNLEFGARLIIAVIVGAVTGATIGFVWGGSKGALEEPSGHNLAAERGVTLAVTVDAARAADVTRILQEAQPIRLDIGTPEGAPVDTISTEEDANR